VWLARMDLFEWVAQVSLLSKLACRRQEKGEKSALLGSIPSTNPDFLWSLVNSLHFMRLSLKEGAHVVLSRVAYRKSGQSTGCPMRLARVKASVLPAVSAPMRLPRVKASVLPAVSAPMRLPRVKASVLPAVSAPILRVLAKGGIVKSHPSISHAKRTCSIGDLGFPG
jgi:hypothetical protein